MSDEWGPWIDHDGRGFPHEVRGRWIHAVGVLPSGAKAEYEDFADDTGEWDWSMFGKPGVGNDGVAGFGGKLLRYRIRKPKALEQLRRIAANPPPLRVPA